MSNNFYTQLKIGNKKEHYVCNVLNICGINAESNNSEVVTDIDLIIHDLKIVMDVKFINTAFTNSEMYTGLKPENCLPITVRHVHNYNNKEQETNYQAWVCFLIKLPDYNINEIKFVPVSLLEHLIETGKASIRDGKLNFDRNICYDMTEFLSYCKKRKEYKPKKYCFR